MTMVLKPLVLLGALLLLERARAEDSGTCGQEEVCGIPCPEDNPTPNIGSASSNIGYGIAVAVFAGISCLIGLATIFFVKGKAENFFVAGRSLPLWIVVPTLAAQSLDSNALLGNVDLGYKFHFWDGAVLPLGLGLSLVLNGIFLARHVNNDEVLTLPDIYAKRYGKVVEILISCICITSFLFLLAGNLVGMGVIVGYLFGIDNDVGSIWISMIVILAYTVCGGLFSVAYTDLFQSAVGWLGCLTLAFWAIKNEPRAPPPSIGFPGYIYPDLIGEGGVCDMYNGVPCDNNATLCCYNSENEPIADNGAYPIGDVPKFSDQMTNPYSLTPFPNAIFFNWCTIFVLAFGNLAALDFQARCMASKSARIATIGCIVAGCLTFMVGIPFGYLGAIVRYYFGPDSVYATFEPNTCSALLGLPTCGLWVPENGAFLQYLTNIAPSFLGGWCLIGIFAASMSTADGAILAMGTVLSNNVLRHLKCHCVTRDNLLKAARYATIPFGVLAAVIASTRPNQTGYLLIVAFDITLATAVVPLFGCFYAKKPRPAAAFAAVCTGVIVRIILEFTLPKDSSLVLPYSGDEFLDFGPAASAKAPLFVDAPAEEVWNPEEEPCDQERFADFTGADSLGAAFCSLTVFLFMQFLERNKPIEESWLCKRRAFRPYKPKPKPPPEDGEIPEHSVKSFGWLQNYSMRASAISASLRSSIAKAATDAEGDDDVMEITNDTTNRSGGDLDDIKESADNDDAQFKEEE
eukprot:CAMPEP_0178538068 /NCGR_PEP_ID=MMETSP0696-20121128/36917_1 /TAXON_ID=265572 /ORGANISM="Extubocellulus spinifer, Strain CCMP396" /LENGTH=745 /DNA_ID=CAMNT_0020170321 /DNA_START=16 /DNA_END=2254 /DNA_ORIENTATION=-